MADRPDFVTGRIPEFLREGYSARQALRAYREAGGRVGNETWFRAWGAVARGIADRQTVALAPLNRRPTGEEISPFETKSQRGFLYQVEIQVRSRGSSEVWTTWGSYRTSKLLPYGEALSGAIDHFADKADEYGEVVLGGYVTNVFEMEPGE